MDNPNPQFNFNNNDSTQNVNDNNNNINNTSTNNISLVIGNTTNFNDKGHKRTRGEGYMGVTPIDPATTTTTTTTTTIPNINDTPSRQGLTRKAPTLDLANDTSTLGIAPTLDFDRVFKDDDDDDDDDDNNDELQNYRKERLQRHDNAGGDHDNKEVCLQQWAHDAPDSEFNPHSRANRLDTEFDREFMDLLKDFAGLELPTFYSENEVCPLCSTTFPTSAFAEHVYQCIKCLDDVEKEHLANLDEQYALALAMQEVEDFDFLLYAQNKSGFDPAEAAKQTENGMGTDDAGDQSWEEKQKQQRDRFLANQALAYNEYKYHHTAGTPAARAAAEKEKASGGANTMDTGESNNADVECCVCGLSVPKIDIDQHVLGCLNTAPQFRLGRGRKKQDTQQQRADAAADKYVQERHESGGVMIDPTASSNGHISNSVSSNNNNNTSSTSSNNTGIISFSNNNNNNNIANSKIQPFTASTGVNNSTDTDGTISNSIPQHSLTKVTRNASIVYTGRDIDDEEDDDEDSMKQKNNDFLNPFSVINDDDEEERDIKRRDEILRQQQLNPVKSDMGSPNTPIVPIQNSCLIIPITGPTNANNQQQQTPQQTTSRVSIIPILPDQIDNNNNNNKDEKDQLNAQQIGLMAKMVYESATNQGSGSLNSLLTTFQALGLNKSSLKRAKDELIGPMGTNLSRNNTIENDIFHQSPQRHNLLGNPTIPPMDFPPPPQSNNGSLIIPVQFAGSNNNNKNNNNNNNNNINNSSNNINNSINNTDNTINQNINNTKR